MSETPLINSWTSAVTVGNPNFILQFYFLAGGCQLSWQYRHFLSLTSNEKNSDQHYVFFGDLLSSAGLSLLRFLNLDRSWKHFGNFCDKRSFRRELFLSSRLSPGRGRVGSGCSPAHWYFIFLFLTSPAHEYFVRFFENMNMDILSIILENMHMDILSAFTWKCYQAYCECVEEELIGLHWKEPASNKNQTEGSHTHLSTIKQINTEILIENNFWLMFSD